MFLLVIYLMLSKYGRYAAITLLSIIIAAIVTIGFPVNTEVTAWLEIFKCGMDMVMLFRKFLILR